MEDKSKFDELLISYFANELNEEDEAFVLGWINFNKENRQYFDKLSSVWKLLNVKKSINNNIDVSDEWKHFKQTINNRQQEAYFFSEVETIASKAEEDKKPKTKRVLYKTIISTAIAASVILLIQFTSGLFKNDVSAEQSFANVHNTKTDTVIAFVTHERNTSGKPKRIILKDGSEIILANKSELTYRDSFVGDRRDVILKGRAYFKVAKDKTRPFTVYSGDISTTVLGTRFTITAFDHAMDITVRLYEGKVVVKPAIGFKKKLINDFYLLPGQELVYNNVFSTAKLRNFQIENTKKVEINNPDKVVLDHEVPSIPLNQKGSWYMFNNQSLEEVFKLLENIYDVRIVYSKREVKNMYFIGRFEKTDPVENILKQIAALNNLNIIKKNDKFIISK